MNKLPVLDATNNNSLETDSEHRQVKFKRFIMHDIFEPLKVIKAKKSEVRNFKSSEFCVPVVYAKFGNNGIMYWGRKNQFTTYKNVISIVYNGAIAAGKVYAQEEPTGILAESYFIRYKYKQVSFRANLYMSQVIEHKIYPIYSRENLAIWNGRVENESIDLPVTSDGKPDFDYMQDYIKELEEDRIKELEAYLKATNLDDYELTDEDKKVLSLSRKSASNENGSLETDCEDGALRFKEFNIGASYTMRGKTIDVDKDGLFNIVPTKIKINAINIEFNGKYPYVARGEGKNGIRGYIDYDEQYLNEANTISFGQDTATVNYQSHRYFTGDKIQVFKLNKKYGNLTEDKAIYLINSIKKVFERFLWGQQSYALDIISKIKITLPVALDGKPDFDYMERYIKAIKKLTIANVVKYKDNVIDTTKKLVNSQS